MHLAPHEAREYLKAFAIHYRSRPDREVWFFPPAVSLEAVAQTLRDRPDTRVGVQNIHWEPKGAFTGETSAPLAVHAGARAALIGHSERRHVFGETDAETQRKVQAALKADLTPVLCVGETLAQRDAGETLAVVTRQLAAALEGLDGGTLGNVVVAYEPVWAIGTGRNASPADAALVHAAVRVWLQAKQAKSPRILYGGSVNLKNVASLLAERELDGVLVGGASLDPETWAQLAQTGAA